MGEDGKWQNDDIAGNLIAHAILGAVVAELQGNSGLAGGAGAVAGEVVADIIRKQLYGKEVKDLTEEEKQTISALSQLAAGLAVAAGGGSVGDAGAAINSSKNAVENNTESMDWWREKHKDSIDYYKDKLRETLGENTISQIINGALTAYGDQIALENSAELLIGIITPSKGLGNVGKTEKLINKSDKVISDANKAGKVISDANKAGKLDEALSDVNKLDKEYFENQYGKNNVEQGFGDYKETKDNINNNHAANQQVNKNSNFDEHVVNEKGLGNAGKGTTVKISPENQKYVDILSPEAKQHILYGDSLTSGGHLYPGNPGKTIFPKNWSADKVVHEIGDIATSPNTQWYAQTGTGGIYTGKGKPANWVSYEVRDGVRIRVVYQPANGKIITAFPDNAPIPNSYKPIK